MIASFKKIICLESLLTAWTEFVRGKRGKSDVQIFERDLMDNLMDLHTDLEAGTYKHGAYHEFRINDPKPRRISKATVRDRLVHHMIHQVIYPFYDRRFIADSFSCRVNKGTHAGGRRFRALIKKASRNHTRTCWVLKCDIKQFFASIEHEKILTVVRQSFEDPHLIALLTEVVDSFSIVPGRGLPLGNLTSQLLANVFMNEFDQFVKHSLREKWYIRYADDFVFMHESREHLQALIPVVADFLENRLGLSLHPNKVSIGTSSAGVDFLGWVHFPKHRVLRRATRRRIYRRLKANPTQETIESYIGLVSHGNASKVTEYCANLKELYR